MVDDIKRPSFAPQRANNSPAGQTRQLVKNFETLRAAAVPEARDTVHLQNAEKAKSARKSGKLLTNLNDAASFSKLALRSLEQAAQGVENGADNEFEQFGGDIEQIRSNISEVVQVLRQRAQTVEIARENYDSSESRIEDIGEATRQLQETADKMQDSGFNGRAAMDAHAGLSPERVFELLREDG